VNTQKRIHEKHTDGSLVHEAEEEGDEERYPDGEGLVRLCSPDGENKEKEVEDNSEGETTALADWHAHVDDDLFGGCEL